MIITRDKVKKNDIIEINYISQNSKNSGISLIALVVTIIVILILAGIAISALSNDNGIFTNAKNAKSKTAYSGAEEEAKLEATNLTTYGIANKITIELANSTVDLAKLAREAYRDLGVADGTKSGWTEVKYSTDDNVIYLKNVNSSLKAGQNGKQDGNIIFKLTLNEDKVNFAGEVDEKTYDGLTNTKKVIPTVEDAIKNGIGVGDTVTYKPVGEEILIAKSVSGSSEDKTIKPEDAVMETWKVWKINSDNTIQLVSASNPGKSGTDLDITLGGVEGYNNGPQILNNICSKLYSGTGIKARNMDAKDIEDAMIEENSSINVSDVAIEATNKDSIKYGETKNINIRSFTNVPLIYGSWTDKSATIPTAEQQTTDLRTEKTNDGKENEEGYITDSLQISNASSLVATKTNYSLPGSSLRRYIGTKRNNILNGRYCWLASRCVGADSDYGGSYFLVRALVGGGLYDCYLSSSSDGSSSGSKALCPSVLLGTSVQLQKGTDGNWTVVQ